MRIAMISMAGILAVSAFAVAAQDTHTLAWNPKKGDKTKYQMKMTGDMDFGQGPMPLEVRISTESEVKNIVDDQITVTSKISKFELFMNGEDMTQMAGGGTEIPDVTRVMSRRGELIKSDANDMVNNPRLEQMQAFVYPDKPLKIGETWTHEFKGDKEKNVPKARAKFTLDALEEKDGKAVYKLTYAFSELETPGKPMGSMGTMWVLRDSGDPYRIDGTINDASFAEGMPPMNMKFEMQKVD